MQNKNRKTYKQSTNYNGGIVLLMIETAINYTDDKSVAFFSSNERKWITKILCYRDQHPDEVRVRYMPENNGGYILADVPKSWLKISPPRKHDLSDEQRDALIIRGKLLGESRRKVQ